MPGELSYPTGTLTAEQQQIALLGRHLFERLASQADATETVDFGAYPLESGGVRVARRVRGGGRIYVAPDGSALYAGSAIPEQTALDEFARGRRTPDADFGPEI